MSVRETGWTADFVYRDGHFESGVAVFAGEDGRFTRFSTSARDLARARKLSNRAIVPGLVNCHSHSFQRVIRGRTEHRSSAQRDTFWTWREAMYRAASRLSPEDIYDVARMAFLEMLLSGITTVGEFHYLHNAPDGSRYHDPNLLAKQVIRAAADTGVRLVLLRAAYLRSGFQKPPNPLQARFLALSTEAYLADTEALRELADVGVAPHSLRAVPLPALLEIVRYAHANKLPVHMHVAEQPAEIEECVAEHQKRPVELLADNGVLDPSFTAVHAIHLNEGEIRALGASGAHICACPTTERNLGDGIVPADRLGAAGASICFGSDSNAQVDLFEDARALEYHLRISRLERCLLAPGQLLASAAEHGAASLGMPCGRLSAERPADFFTIDLEDVSLAGTDHDSLVSHLVFSTQRTAIRDVFVGGHPIIQDGMHRFQDEIVQRFASVQRRLWR